VGAREVQPHCSHHSLSCCCCSLHAGLSVVLSHYYEKQLCSQLFEIVDSTHVRDHPIGLILLGVRPFQTTSLPVQSKVPRRSESESQSAWAAAQAQRVRCSNFDIQSTGQKSHCVNIFSDHRNALF